MRQRPAALDAVLASGGDVEEVERSQAGKEKAINTMTACNEDHLNTMRDLLAYCFETGLRGFSYRLGQGAANGDDSR